MKACSRAVDWIWKTSSIKIFTIKIINRISKIKIIKIPKNDNMPTIIDLLIWGIISCRDWILFPIIAKPMKIISFQLHLFPLEKLLFFACHILHNLLELAEGLLFQFNLEIIFFDQVISFVGFFSRLAVWTRLPNSVKRSFISSECFRCAWSPVWNISESACQSFLYHILQNELRHFCFVSLLCLMFWSLLLQFFDNSLVETSINQCYFIRHQNIL